ncbi:MAG: hypothetical protein NVS2B7_11950 [Herpetosiphon sp.]
MAGRISVELLDRAGMPWQKNPQAMFEQPGCRFFPETQHSICPPFLAYWEQNGGLQRFGFPLSEPQDDPNPGCRGIAQFFERRRAEWHPENQPPYDILLSRLGNDVYTRVKPATSMSCVDSLFPKNNRTYWSGHWDASDKSQWAINAGGSAGNSDVVVVQSPTDQRKLVGKLTVNPSPGHMNPRAEISATQENTGGYADQEWFYSWSAYFPSDPDKTTGWGEWNLFTQWMDLRHKCSPPLQLDVHSGNPDFISLENIITRQHGVCSEQVHTAYVLGPLIYDHWIDFTVHIKWSTDPSVGYTEAWVDNRLALPKTYMQTMDPGTTGVYMEQDMYRPNPPGASIVYLSNTRRHK